MTLWAPPEGAMRAPENKLWSLSEKIWGHNRKCRNTPEKKLWVTGWPQQQKLATDISWNSKRHPQRAGGGEVVGAPKLAVDNSWNKLVISTNFDTLQEPAERRCRCPWNKLRKLPENLAGDRRKERTDTLKTHRRHPQNLKGHSKSPHEYNGVLGKKVVGIIRQPRK